MRRLFVLSVLLLFSATAGLAQSRWTFSVGPEWTKVTPTISWWGMRLRAEYDLIKPPSVFGLRLEGGARWGPNQHFFSESSSRTEFGAEQQMDLMLGFTGSLSPLPRARFSPYVAMGIFGRQMWRRGSRFTQDSVFGTTNDPYFLLTRREIIGTLGLGLRARISGRSFQLELREIYNHYGLSFGTRLPF